jgi:ribose 5-phosphate isomerase B
MKVAIGADHGGFDLKQKIILLLKKLNHEIYDAGCHSNQSVDYPQFADAVCESIIAGDSEVGILVCGTGIGMSMAANRNRKIRAANCHNEYTARMSREHNNANILCIGARVLGEAVVEEIIRVWLETEFAGGRHQQRIQQYSE